MEVQSVQQQSWQPSKKNRVMSGMLGAAIATAPSAYVFYDSFSKVTPEKLEKSAATMKALMPEVDTLENIKRYASDALEKTGLASKGVKIKYVNKENANEVAEELAKLSKKEPFGEKMANKVAQVFAWGGNAAFSSPNNKIYIGEKGAYSGVFHEMGHALNHNSSKFFKFLQKARVLTYAGVPVLGIGLFIASLFHKVKPESAEHPKSAWEKTKDFVKNNAGKIALATYIPMLVEEAAASVKGIKIAKNYLNPQQVSKLAKNYTKAFGTYALTAALLSGAIGLGNMISEGIKKPEKNA